jgi:hypothetical protein
MVDQEPGAYKRAAYSELSEGFKYFLMSISSFVCNIGSSPEFSDRGSVPSIVVFHYNWQVR